jgi:uncharacterized protein YkwD
MKTALFALLTIAVALTAALLFQPGGTGAAPELDAGELQLLDLINGYRAQNGLAPLVTDARLNASADWFANDMANDNYWASNHRDNEDPPRSPGQRAAAFGFNAPVGENLAAGYVTPQAAFDAWRGSAGHNANMLGNYVGIGIGVAYNAGSNFGWYWVTDFALYIPPGGPTATPKPTAPPPTATPRPTATPAPTPVPTAAPRSWGDLDCDGHVGPVDSIRVLREDAGLFTATTPGCPAMGAHVVVNARQRTWGDVNCRDGVDPVDSVLLLRYDAGLDVTAAAGCPILGALV